MRVMTRNLFLGADLTPAYDALRAAGFDLVLTRGGIAATEAFVVGDEPGDFRAGLWPSDHAGVFATLEPV